MLLASHKTISSSFSFIYLHEYISIQYFWFDKVSPFIRIEFENVDEKSINLSHKVFNEVDSVHLAPLNKLLHKKRISFQDIENPNIKGAPLQIIYGGYDEKINEENVQKKGGEMKLSFVMAFTGITIRGFIFIFVQY